MSSVVVSGDTSGAITIAAPAVAGSNTMTLPAATDTFAVQSQAVRQIVSTVTGASSTGTTQIPYDDTIPQNTEGTEFMSVTITPKSATSKLVITTTAMLASGVNVQMTGALFQDSTANAIACATSYAPSDNQLCLAFTYVMTSGTTSATTFKFRAGGNSAATFTFNGRTGSRFMGGAFASSIVIMEVGG